MKTVRIRFELLKRNILCLTMIATNPQRESFMTIFLLFLKIKDLPLLSLYWSFPFALVLHLLGNYSDFLIFDLIKFAMILTKGFYIIIITIIIFIIIVLAIIIMRVNLFLCIKVALCRRRANYSLVTFSNCTF